MDSNFKPNQLYLFSDLTIAKVVNEHYSYPTFENIKTKKQFASDIINPTTRNCTELLFEQYTYHFLTESFELAFNKNSSLIKAKGLFDFTIIRGKNHINLNIGCEKNKFKLIEENKIEHILVSNFESDKMKPILRKYNRLFECL